MTQKLSHLGLVFLFAGMNVLGRLRNIALMVDEQACYTPTVFILGQYSLSPPLLLYTRHRTIFFRLLAQGKALD